MTTHPLLISATPKSHAHKPWRFHHDDAVRHPRPGAEDAIVSMAAAIDKAADILDGPDAVGTPAVGELLSGFRTLLNYDLGRLDAGTCEAWAWKCAERIGWDLDTETIKWEAA